MAIFVTLFTAGWMEAIIKLTFLKCPLFFSLLESLIYFYDVNTVLALHLCLVAMQTKNYNHFTDKCYGLSLFLVYL